MSEQGQGRARTTAKPGGPSRQDAGTEVATLRQIEARADALLMMILPFATTDFKGRGTTPGNPLQQRGVSRSYQHRGHHPHQKRPSSSVGNGIHASVQQNAKRLFKPRGHQLTKPTTASSSSSTTNHNIVGMLNLGIGAPGAAVGAGFGGLETAGAGPRSNSPALPPKKARPH
ncbi:hypothetical protein HK101_003542, partial [Irineochytrium annulatum]